MTDVEILKLIAAQDESGLAELERKYSGYCRAVAFNVLGDRNEAEECVNDAFLRIWNATGREAPEKLKSYLGKTVRNIALNRYRDNNNSKHRVLSCAEPLEDADRLAAPEVNYDRDITIAALINEFLHSQPEKKQKIFVAKYYYEMTDDEIATLLGIPRGSVKSGLSRMKKELRRRFEEEGISV